MTGEKRESDCTCPIMCGICCDYWGDVEELREKYPKHSVWDDCPNLADDGCKLPRNERPSACLHYLCTEALYKVFPDDITKQIEKLVTDAVEDVKCP